MYILRTWYQYYVIIRVRYIWLTHCLLHRASLWYNVHTINCIVQAVDAFILAHPFGEVALPHVHVHSPLSSYFTAVVLIHTPSLPKLNL